MPRIRTLKPEHKQHRKVGKLTHPHYRLWVGLVTEADDAGRCVVDPDQIRIIVFPYHPKESAKRIQTGLEELQRVGLCQLYVVEGVQYAVLHSFRDHQRISHPSRSRLPDPPGTIPEDSGGFARIPEGSTGIGRIGRDQGLDRIGGDGSVREGEPRRPAHAARGRSTITAADLERMDAKYGQGAQQSGGPVGI